MRSRIALRLVAVLVAAAGAGLVSAAVFGDVLGSDADTVTGQVAGDVEVLLAAGDIAECPTNGDEATAKVVEGFPDATVATLGDNAYPDGSETDFQQCYEPSWGKFRERTRPATGNHDFHTKDAAGFSDYFGEAGGKFDQYYYSYDLGDWHIVVLNSDCWRVDGCELQDPQILWLRSELQSAPLCTLAYMHRPPFSSGRYGEPKDTERVRPIWQALYEEGVDVLVTGHEHSYERFTPMNADGEPDDAGGVRLFVVGTGGGNLRPFRYEPLPTTEIRNDTTWGVLKLTLRADRYDWEFLPVEGGTFRDSGSWMCH